MTRWRIDLAYDGTDFHGWASQPGLRTVQGTLEEWIPKVLRLPEQVQLVVAGRTDSGVHARSQVCHFDLDGDDDIAEELTHRLRRVLPEDIAIHHVSLAPEGFDARFSAIWRRYCYRLIDTAATPDPLRRREVTPVQQEVDINLLNRAAQLLQGLRDFAPFCKARDGATTIRDLRELEASRDDDGVIQVHLLADAFCHSMVRSVVGALTQVATGKRSLEWLVDVSRHTVRHGEVPVMPARGLCLEEVGYPADDELAARAVAARAFRTLEET